MVGYDNNGFYVGKFPPINLYNAFRLHPLETKTDAPKSIKNIVPTNTWYDMRKKN